ncbi:phosphatidate cytidylyltransferase [Hephaestia sp. GCM10023244]|uniref:phosphatidate cytidylyltransferase n=1 Tax=unclassified Hephaestia TaxID=2631281 RepID=UPI002077818F|nr:phosphatidate cytidylyltransferase [Hephaestia sp. MAHUQ-44]MCM8731441.1 phosphatidate cytidylyltransferase [Hephaestia sp. MAHUQ-44]
MLRVVAGIALIVVAVAALVFGGMAFWLLAAVMALLMMGEWADLAKMPPQTRRLAQYALFVPLAIFSPFAAGPDFFALGLLLGAAFFIVIVTKRPILGWGIFYCGLPVFALLLIRETPGNGVVFAFWALALVWATDIGAYAAGRAIGGPKLAPAISPNKTWAGLGGGVLAAALLGITLHYSHGLPLRLTLASPLLGVVAQGGDLFESWLKRRAGVKDSGAILPGHGGVLDRLDGLVPVAPLAALLVLIPIRELLG